MKNDVMEFVTGLRNKVAQQHDIYSKNEVAVILERILSYVENYPVEELTRDEIKQELKAEITDEVMDQYFVEMERAFERAEFHDYINISLDGLELEVDFHSDAACSKIQALIEMQLKAKEEKKVKHG